MSRSKATCTYARMKRLLYTKLNANEREEIESIHKGKTPIAVSPVTLLFLGGEMNCNVNLN